MIKTKTACSSTDAEACLIVCANPIYNVVDNSVLLATVNIFGEAGEGECRVVSALSLGSGLIVDPENDGCGDADRGHKGMGTAVVAGVDAPPVF